MKQQARSLGLADGNCLLCHGKSIPAALNHRGEWLVEEKARRESDQMDMSWLADYEEPAPDDAPESPEPDE